MSTMTQTARTADEATAEILSDIHRGEPAVVIDSPPGAGKTTTGNKITATAWGLLKENAMVACWTNRQAIDFAARLAKSYSKIPVQLFIKEDLNMIAEPLVRGLSNLHIVNKAGDLTSEGVAVSNASKWLAYPINHSYEWLLVDEAYQLPEYRFQQLTPLACRYVLVGDPGQIAPLIQADVSPWGSDPDGPQVPSPKALLARYADTTVHRLPVSWRLPRDTAAIVRDAFYEFDFESGDPAGKRRLVLKPGSKSDVHKVLDELSEPDTSIVAAVLPDEKLATDVDPAIAAFAAAAAEALLHRKAASIDERNPRPVKIEPKDIGIVTAHRAQVAEIEKQLRSLGLPTGPHEIVVETTERWQGLERKVMLVQHPLAGIERLSSFDLDRGRLCVMLSRHSIACVMIGRAGVGEAIKMHSHEGERFPGTADEEYLGWRAHHEVWSKLDAFDRQIPVRP